MKRLHFTKCRTSLLAVLLAFSVAFVPVPPISDTSSDSAALITTAQAAQKNTKDRFSIKEVPKYNGKSSVAVHGNKPYFTSREKQNTNTFESYHKLDKLGRCGVAYANVSKDTMPTEARGEIGQIRPSGWHTVKYTGVVDGNYLYNRCHLIAYCLTAENANKKNLITGTRYLNVEGMLPFENLVADYIKETGNHVLYRVTPIFAANDLVTRGVQMEAESIEDGGQAVRFNVFVYNVEPGVEIDYVTGKSWESSDVPHVATGGEATTTGAGTTPNATGKEANNASAKSSNGNACSERTNNTTPKGNTENSQTNQANNATGSSDATNPSNGAGSEEDSATSYGSQEYVLNTKSMKFHRPTCSSVDDIADSNKQEATATRDELISEGYSPCKQCNP